MAEAITLLVFVIMLLGCVVTGGSVLYALAGGLICFSVYTLYKGYGVSQLGQMIWKGVRDSQTILVVFVLIGCLTALWRASGTIPCIVYYSASSMSPGYYLVLTFLLCCGMSALTGTSFGTVSTMGVICASIGRAMDIPDVYIGGAVMSGIYFGEQCSPMSSSALLVCELTNTNIYGIITKVFKEVRVPLALTAVLYFYLGRDLGRMSADAEGIQIFAETFRMGGIIMIPAVVIICFSVFRIRVEYAMLVSILTAIVLCISFQGMDILDVISTMVWGYQAGKKELAELINGGGLVSMVDIGAIVAISSAYFGIFSSTGLLLQLKKWVENLSRHSNVFFATMIVSVITCAISCNQTLASMLTCEMTKKLVRDKERLAVNLEATVIVIAGLIPWSIACAFPLSVVEAPKKSLLYASYLYLVPLWGLVKSVFVGWKRQRKEKF